MHSNTHIFATIGMLQSKACELIGKGTKNEKYSNQT